MSSATFYFPKNFKWGTATAAHQVEGGNTNNQWHIWEQTPGHIANNDKSSLACDWWNNAEADFDRMVEINQNAHRLSIEWSRIEPREGVYDTAAIDRYRQMLLGLRQRGIEPMVTLHHFTNPIWLEEQGAWENADLVVPKFERFAEKAAQSFGDLCDFWCTINEPNIYGVMCYLSGGRMPPGKEDMPLALRVMQNMMLGHAAAYHALHRVQPMARVGFAHHIRPMQPASRRNPLDGIAAKIVDGMFNWSLFNVIQTGKWDRLMGRGAPSAKALKGTLDWVGVNYYTRQFIKFQHQNNGSFFAEVSGHPEGAVISDFNYGEIYPQGFLIALRKTAQLGVPIYITENGLPDEADAMRPAFLAEHVRQIWLAANFNWNIAGYYHWSLVDNFEWGEGWRMKFGLYAVDHITQTRVLRKSGRLYGEISKANALSAEMVQEYAPELMEKMFPD